MNQAEHDRIDRILDVTCDVHFYGRLNVARMIADARNGDKAAAHTLGAIAAMIKTAQAQRLPCVLCDKVPSEHAKFYVGFICPADDSVCICRSPGMIVCEACDGDDIIVRLMEKLQRALPGREVVRKGEVVGHA